MALFRCGANGALDLTEYNFYVMYSATAPTITSSDVWAVVNRDGSAPVLTKAGVTVTPDKTETSGSLQKAWYHLGAMSGEALAVTGVGAFIYK